MKVSVIIPVFNDPRIEQCLDALSRQTIGSHNFEVIVIDNGSKVPPTTLIEKYPFARLEIETTPGSYAARNRALRIARGEVLAFTDSDCIPSPNWLSSGLADIEDSAGPVIVGGRINVFPQDLIRPKAVELYDIALAFDQELTIQEFSYSVTANLIVPRSLFDRIGPFNQKLLSGGDGEWCHRAIGAGFPIRYCDAAVVNHPARTTLAELIRKKRRVVGGRHQRNRRSLWSKEFWQTAVRFIVPNFGRFERGRRRLLDGGYGHRASAKLAGLMVLSHYIGVFEYFWVRLGGSPERR